MFYYLVVTYNIHDLELEDKSHLVGPFESDKEREESIERMLNEEVLQNITKLQLENYGGLTEIELVRTHSETMN